LGTGLPSRRNIGCPLAINRNPRNVNPYFNTSLFKVAMPGSPGDAQNRFFCWLGIEN
jgi:hypothetical protein